MSQWTDSIENNLIAMHQNAKKLAENYLETYNSFKNVTTYLNVPLLLLSALNAYVIFDADSYSRGVQLGSSATSLGIAIILSGEFVYMFRNKIENTFLKFKNYEYLELSLKQTLSVDRLHRSTDANDYFEETFRQYKTLVSDDYFIMKYLGNLDMTDEMNTEDIPAILDDHWNILFRPTFRRIKRKNQKVIEALKTTGQSIGQGNGQDISKSESSAVKKEDVKNLSSWWAGIWKKEEVLIPVLATPPVVTEKPAGGDDDVESWGSSFWKVNKEDAEEKKIVEMANVYPDILQKVVYEPIKRTGFAMSFSEKK